VTENRIGEFMQPADDRSAAIHQGDGGRALGARSFLDETASPSLKCAPAEYRTLVATNRKGEIAVNHVVAIELRKEAAVDACRCDLVDH
jgi:hypothetical protein